jgi:uncharacterized protein
VHTQEMAEKLGQYFADRSEVVAAYLFGSWASGKQRTSRHAGLELMSDVDIAVLLDETLSKAERLKISERMYLDLSRLLRMDIDLLVLNGSSYVVRMQALFKGLLVHVKDELTLARFKTTSYSLYAGFMPIFRQMQDGMAKRYGAAND